ncbi:MAG: response regulator transcription factor [Chloroflexota bacterium]
MVKIVLGDDHHIVRQGFKALLEKTPEFSVIGEADTGLVIPDLVERLKPDILITDLMMPGLNGLEVTRQVKQRIPTVGVIILSMHDDESYVLQALANGADAYVLKGAKATDLLQAVNAVLIGQRYLSPPLSERAIDSYVQKSRETLADPYNSLTTREREVIQLVVEGHTNVDIAKALSISARTVEVHRANMMHKLGLRTQTDLIRYALRRGILPDET